MSRHVMQFALDEETHQQLADHSAHEARLRTPQQRKILIMGLPGAGKTTLARMLAPRLQAVWFNADEVRANINRDLGFSHADRIEHARRMGWLCDRVVDAGGTVIADFVCPTPETRQTFGPAFVVWVDRIGEGRFADTNKLFVPPSAFDMHVTDQGEPLVWADRIADRLFRQRV